MSSTPGLPCLKFAAVFTCLLAAAGWLSGCSKAMTMRMRPEVQGLYGTFITYGPLPKDQMRDCQPLVTQAEKDGCRKFNEQIVEEPLQATLRIRNLATDEVTPMALDAQGSYRVKLPVGSYQVCIEGDCSDPLDVTLNVFVAYGGRLPRK